MDSIGVQSSLLVLLSSLKGEIKHLQGKTTTSPLVWHLLPLSLQAIANESGINFISVKGPELLNMVLTLAVVYKHLSDK